jgi:hypothetical protein
MTPTFVESLGTRGLDYTQMLKTCFEKYVPQLERLIAVLFAN